MNKRNIILTILVLVIAGGAIAILGGESSPDDQPPAQMASTNATSARANQNQVSADLSVGTYRIQPSRSTVTWTATKELIADYKDTGTFPVSGRIIIDESGLADGTVTFDIANLAVTSVSNSQAGTDRLAKHLRSDDFFAADRYPTSTLDVVSVEPTSTSSNPNQQQFQVTADLTLKGTTKEISFPARIGAKDNSIIIRADTSIDRTRWGIRYGSDSFFDNLGNNVISDAVDISARLQAQRVMTERATSSQTQ